MLTDHADASTVGASGTSPFTGVSGDLEVPVVPALTIQCHPEPQRLGERALLGQLTIRKPARLSRNEPEFFQPGGTVARPLEDPYISRQPLVWEVRRDDALTLLPGASRTRVKVGGEVLGARLRIPFGDLQEGVVIELSSRVTLLLHLHTEVREKDPRTFGLVGANTAIQRLREEIRSLGDLPTPVLIRGATGTGKELVARALHNAGPHPKGPFLGVNLGALPPALAAAELFGAVRGAYTGATRDLPGFFRKAQQGTLFLDEIGEAPPEVQVMLLRVLETGEVQPLGAPRPEPVEARIVAATDADLEGQARSGTFREPLIHRLSGYVLRLPSLARRRDDIGRLLLHFLRQELEETGETFHLEPPTNPARPWLPTELVRRLLDFSWPGNVRQLRNVVRQLVIGNRGRSRLKITPGVEELLRESSQAPEPNAPGGEAGSPGSDSRRPTEVTAGEVAAALEKHRWELAAAARELQISRPSLYNLIRKDSRLRTAGDLSTEEIQRSFGRSQGNLEQMVEELEVSSSALRRRIRELGLE